MPPAAAEIARRAFVPGAPSTAFWSQWQNPGDVFSVLLILGGDVVNRALAQLTGSPVTPVAFSFGWVAYAVTAVVSASGENKLMPLPDCSCKVINAKSGYVRDNTSWILGRIVRDYESWMDNGNKAGPIRRHWDHMIQARWAHEKKSADAKDPGSGVRVPKPTQAGLCVSIFEAGEARKGYPGFDLVYWIGFASSIVQLGVAAIPCGIWGNWGILLVTVAGILLSFATGSLPQWAQEKWACRERSHKDVVLTRGNGSQHAIVILGNGRGLDLEDLAAGQTNVDVSASWFTRLAVTLLAALWILLLITAAGIKQNTWFLLAIGGIGILQNIFVAGWRRFPEAYGIALTFKEVIGEQKVMETLFAVEEKYPHVGTSMRETFFPGRLRADEVQKWQDLEKAATAGNHRTGQQNGAAQPAAAPIP